MDSLPAGAYFSSRTMQIKKYLTRTIVAWVVLLAFMMVSRPQKLAVLLLIVPFVLLFTALVSSWSLIVAVLHRLSGKRTYAGNRRLRLTVCGSLVLCLILQSLGQLTLRDFFTIVAIAGLGYAYIGRSRSTQSTR